MSKKAKVGTKVSGKGKGKVDKNAKPTEEKIPEPILTETPAPISAETPKVVKNTMRLADGTEILVRGPEKNRAAYVMGNVGWQDFLRPARLALNLATYASKIGASDAVVTSLMAEVEKTMHTLAEQRVKIPSDMTTQHAILMAGLPEATIGSPDYIIATRKLSGLVKFVSDSALNKAIMAEYVSASLALKASKE